MPAHVRVGTLKTYIDGTRPRPFVRPVSKDVFLTLLSVIDKSSKFESWNRGDATRSVYVGRFYIILRSTSLYIYNKVYPTNGRTLFVYICMVWPRCMHIYRSAWAGFTLLILK